MTLGFKVHDSTHIYNSVVNTMKARIVEDCFKISENKSLSSKLLNGSEGPDVEEYLEGAEDTFGDQ